MRRSVASRTLWRSPPAIAETRRRKPAPQSLGGQPVGGKASAPSWLRGAAQLDWSKCGAAQSVAGKTGNVWVVRGTHVPLAAVLKAVAEGHPFAEIAEVYQLPLQPLLAILQFAVQGGAGFRPGWRAKEGREPFGKLRAGSGAPGTLTWNANGTLNNLQINDNANAGNVQNCGYAYDDLARLASVSCGSVWQQTFSYDAFGNITKAGSVIFNPGYNGNGSSTTTRMVSATMAWAT